MLCSLCSGSGEFVVLGSECFQTCPRCHGRPVPRALAPRESDPTQLFRALQAACDAIDCRFEVEDLEAI